jgi:hypothetical protein
MGTSRFLVAFKNDTTTSVTTTSDIADAAYPDDEYDDYADLDNWNKIFVDSTKNVVEEIDIETFSEYHLHEPREWDPRTAFIENVATKLYYVVPAFVFGLLLGVIMWMVYILLYKTTNVVQRSFSRMTLGTPSEDNITAVSHSQFNE